MKRRMCKNSTYKKQYVFSVLSHVRYRLEVIEKEDWKSLEQAIFDIRRFYSPDKRRLNISKIVDHLNDILKSHDWSLIEILKEKLKKIYKEHESSKRQTPVHVRYRKKTTKLFPFRPTHILKNNKTNSYMKMGKEPVRAIVSLNDIDTKALDRQYLPTIDKDVKMDNIDKKTKYYENGKRNTIVG